MQEIRGIVESVTATNAGTQIFITATNTLYQGKRISCLCQHEVRVTPGEPTKVTGKFNDAGHLELMASPIVHIKGVVSAIIFKYETEYVNKKAVHYAAIDVLVDGGYHHKQVVRILSDKANPRVDDIIVVDAFWVTDKSYYRAIEMPHLTMVCTDQAIAKLIVMYTSVGVYPNKQALTQDQAMTMLKMLERKAIHDKFRSVEQMLCHYAYQYHVNHRDSYGVFHHVEVPLTQQQYAQWMHKWYVNRLERKVFMMGLEKEELRDALSIGYTVDRLVEECEICPYRIPSLSAERGAAIMAWLKRQPTVEEISMGSHARTVYRYLIDKRCTSVPMSEIQRCTSTWKGGELSMLVATQRPELLDQYGLVYANDSLYIKTVLDIEDYLVDWIKHKIERNRRGIISKVSALEAAQHQDPFSTPDVKVSQDLSGIIFERTDLTAQQKEAVAMALTNDISIISGGPGTGKTTIIGEIVNNLEAQGVDYWVVSFTGKAVARVRSVIKRNRVSTMHRLLNNNQPIEHLIIDEFSMVATKLFHDFVMLHDCKRITMVGDKNQLEPIDWGSICQQMLLINTIPRVILEANHRMGSGATNMLLTNIAKFGNAIHTMQPYQIDLGNDVNSDDTSVILYDNSGDRHTVHRLVTDLRDAGVPREQLVVLCPYREDCRALNIDIQTIFNTGNYPYVADSHGTKWMLHDRVMMTANNYMINVMNGEDGTITAVHPEGYSMVLPVGTVFSPERVAVVNGITVQDKLYDIDLDAMGVESWDLDYAGNRTLKREATMRVPVPCVVVDFGNERINIFEVAPAVKGDSVEEEQATIQRLHSAMLLHSMAITAHKCQGSEWPYVIMFFPTRQFDSFVNSNMIYTMLSRPKLSLYIIGMIDYIDARSSHHSPPPHDRISQRVMAR